MPEFTYIAKTQGGERSEGILTAATRQEALQQLKRQSLFPVRVADAKSTTIELPTQWKWKRKVRAEVVADLCTQMADLLNNGVPLLETLSILSEAAVQPQMKESLTEIREQISEGANLDQAMAAHPHLFSELAISMVRAGLEGAFLEDALERVSAFLRKQDELRAKIIGSLTYPAILGIVGTLITSGLIVFMVPKFQPFFDRLEQNGGGLPLVTVILLGLSDFLMKYGVFLVVGLAFAVVGSKRWMSTKQGRRMMDRVKLKLPLLGKIFHDAAVSRFCRVLGTLLRNGVPILKSLQISSQSSGNSLLAEVIQQSAENVTSGESLAKPLSTSGLIPPQVMAMIRVAEESNSLDDVLVKIADRMDQMIERRLEVIVRMIEPLMLVFIGGMVMFVIVGVLLPVFDLNSTVG